MRHTIEFSYNGASFSGYQRQLNAPSVQQTLEQALSILLREEISITGAGRTDSGVNAVNYLAHFDCQEEFDPQWLHYKLNAILPQTVAIHAIKLCKDDFHARFDAKKRTYKYFIHYGKDPFAEAYSWRCPYRLDLEKMQKAADLMLGTRDFSCFEKKGSDNLTSICELYSLNIAPYTPTLVSELGFTGAEHYVITVSANRFLRNMVRAIVGTLVDVGRSRITPEDIPAILESCDRSRSGESVPAKALFLCKIDY